MPVRSPRRLYRTNLITVDQDDIPDVIDKLPGDTTPQTTRPIIIKMKEGIGDLLGFKPLAWNDPIFDGIFKGTGLNKGAKYRKLLGGYRDASYTLIAETQFTVKEKFINSSGSFTTLNTKFNTVSIGFPKGHSVNEVIKWLGTSTAFDQIAALRTPAGHRIDLYTPV
jgi:hypothetical protein